ncbi:unnamed protein product [Peronospora destructor]|uniref:RanBD1 domain-containing protein n=1 Tax=Peronospora destructor TaxID=86335 RepID=A0AAV0V1S8_9STRA|nr:unnamed protein product [Peronospora destructor]
MAKRRNEDGQMRREEYEAADEGKNVNAESCELGFQRASEDSISKRRIVKARTRPPVVTKPKAAAIEDNAVKSNPFGGFQGLTAAKPAASKPFDGVISGLSGAVHSDKAKTSSGISAASFKSYQEAMETLNKEFLAFVTDQLQRNPSVSWMAAVQDYVKYAAEIATKYASTRPVTISETKQAKAVPAPFSFGATPASASTTSAATTPSSSSFSFDGSNAGAKKKGETPASSGFSLGAAVKKDDESIKPASRGFSFGGADSSLFSIKSSDEEEKTIPAFSFGTLSKPVTSAASSTPATGDFSFGNAPAPKSIASTSSGGLSFGVSAVADPTSTSTIAGDEAEENIGREEATVIIKADSSDDECTFEADKAKVFEFKKDEKRWADKGVHPLKVLVSKDTKSGRILVRNEIGKVVLNSALYKGIAVRPHETKGKKTGVTLALQIDNALTQFLIKVNTTRVDEFIKALKSAAGSS